MDCPWPRRHVRAPLRLSAVPRHLRASTPRTPPNSNTNSLTNSHSNNTSNSSHINSHGHSSCNQLQTELLALLFLQAIILRLKPRNLRALTHHINPLHQHPHISDLSNKQAHLLLRNINKDPHSNRQANHRRLHISKRVARLANRHQTTRLRGPTILLPRRRVNLEYQHLPVQVRRLLHALFKQ